MQEKRSIPLKEILKPLKIRYGYNNYEYFRKKKEKKELGLAKKQIYISHTQTL